MIRFEQVGKRYANGHVGLHELSFRVRRGEFLFVTGHSGAGKSTLLRLLLAMERPTTGKLLLAGQDLATISNAQIPFLRRQIGVVFQNHQLLFDRTVFNNVALPLQILGLSKAEIVKRVDSALERVALSDKTDLYPGDLSTGQQQRVGIARAIVHRPALLLADEPTGNLDPRLAAEIMGGVRRHQSLGHQRADRQSRPGADRTHAPSHADPATRPPDRRRGGRRMSATRSPKVSERVAPKPADPQPQKKKHDHDDDGPDFGTLLRAWIESHRASLLDSLRRLGKQPIGSFFTCLVMAVALSLPMGLSLLLNNVERLGGSWQRAAQISLYLNIDASAKDGESLRDDIKNLPGVADAEYISRDQALEEFQQQSGLGEALKELPQNPLPGVVLVTPNEVDKPALEALRQKLAEMPKVQQAQLDLVWVERLAAILKLGDRFVFGLTVLLVSALLLVIGNTIRLHIENRRTEIEVIKLVGGTDSYVRRPFLYMGALYGFGAGILSWGVLAFGLDWLNDAVVGLAGLYGSDFALAGVPVADGLSLLLGAVLLGYIGAWIAVARHLRELAPK